MDYRNAGSTAKVPERPWDYHTRALGGIYVWFEENIYIQASIVHEMEIDQSTNKLRIKGAEPRSTCESCKAGNDCTRHTHLPICVQEARDKWWYDMFESKFLGKDDET